MASHFDTPLPSFDIPRNYNVAPTADIAAVVGHIGPHDEGGAALRRLEVFQWGLVPSWAKDRRIGARMINARAETVATKNTFRSALRHRRCIVPADGFYEWPRTAPGVEASGCGSAGGGALGHRNAGNGSDSGGGPAPNVAKPMPRYIYRADGEPLAMAGLWERWRPPDTARSDPDGPDASARDGPLVLHTASVLTTAANEFMDPIHDRMPVLLPRSAWNAWLDPRNHDTDALTALCQPAPEGLLASHAVGRAVGNVANSDAGLIEPAERDTLF